MKKMLVVDDEVGICDFLNDFFKNKKHKVFTAITGEAALGIISQERPDVILLDMKLPDIQGPEFFDKTEVPAIGLVKPPLPGSGFDFPDHCLNRCLFIDIQAAAP